MKNYKRESNSIYKYTLANLNLRSSKSTSGDIITVIPQGSKVEILDGAEDWYEVIYNNQRGYVYNQYLSKTKYTWTDVFLRSFPTSESNSVALVPDKSIVQVLSSNGDWDHVIFNDKEGYIFNYFLSDDGNPPGGYDFEYLGICCILSLGVILFTIYEKLLQSTGKTVLCTIGQLAGALTNIVLDPILIFGYLGMPQMGVAGAAYATVIGQFVSLILDMIFHYGFNNDVDRQLRYIKPKKRIIKDIYIVGVPAILMQALMSFMTYGVNIIFISVSTAAVTAYGVYYKIQQFVFFAAFGLNNAIIPIVSFNYGMKDKQRVKDGIHYGMMYTLIIMGIGLVVLQIFAHQVASIFALSPDIQKLCILSIRIITIGYLFAGANIAYQGIFQALGCGVHSLIISLLRLIIVALPLAWLFTKVSNSESMIWWAFPIAEGVALIVSLFMMRKINKDRVKELS